MQTATTPSAVVLRRAVPDDTAACIRLRGLTRENAIPAERLAALGITLDSWSAGIEQGHLPGQVATQQGELVGYCFGDRRTGEVVVLALLPAWEGQGLGARLLAQVVEVLRAEGFDRLFLGCSADPASRSHGFYRHLGWRPTGERDDHGDELLELPMPGWPAKSRSGLIPPPNPLHLP